MGSLQWVLSLQKWPIAMWQVRNQNAKTSNLGKWIGPFKWVISFQKRTRPSSQGVLHIQKGPSFVTHNFKVSSNHWMRLSNNTREVTNQMIKQIVDSPLIQQTFALSFMCSDWGGPVHKRKNRRSRTSRNLVITASQQKLRRDCKGLF